MPKPVPIPVREKLWERAARGESAACLAEFYDLSPRTVRHLLKRARERGDSGLLPSYRAPSTLDHAHPDEVREAVLALRRDHPTWGGNDRVKGAHPDRLKRAHLGLEDGRSGQER
jgi:hypothetical protein